MLIRIGCNYWAGAWLMGAGIAIAAVLGTVTDRPHASWLLGGLVAVAGIALWAYRFHTEPH